MPYELILTSGLVADETVIVNGRVLLEDGQPAITAGPWPGRVRRQCEE